MKVLIRVLGGLACVILLCLLAVYIWFHTRPAWISPTSKGQARIPRVETLQGGETKQDNPYVFLSEITKLYEEKGFENNPLRKINNSFEIHQRWVWEGWDNSQSKIDYLEWHEPALTELSRLPNFKNRRVPEEGKHHFWNSYSAVTNLFAMAALVQADKLADGGSWAEAIRLNMNAQHLARYAGAGPDFLDSTSYFTAKRDLLRQVRKWVFNYKSEIPSSELSKLKEFLSNERSGPSFYLEMIRSSNRISKLMVPKFRSELSGQITEDGAGRLIRLACSSTLVASFIGSSESDIKRDLERYWTQLYISERQGTPLELRGPLTELSSNPPKPMSWYFNFKNPIDLIGMGVPVSFYESRKKTIKALRLMNTVTEITLAIELFKRESGSYPNSIIDLIPNYFDNTPLDPYKNKPFSVKRLTGSQDAKWLIYTVGENGIDEKGGNYDPRRPYRMRASNEHGDDWCWPSDEAIRELEKTKN